MEEDLGPILMVGQEIMRRTKMLEEAAYPGRRKLTRGMDSGEGENVRALTWKCPKCGKVNRPERRLLLILPVIVCSCGEESQVQFDFSLHQIEVNDHFLIPIIRKQEPKECSPCSILSLAEISWRANAILSGQVLEDSEPCLNRTDMLQKYNYLCDVCGIEKRFNQTAVQTLLDVFSTIGVQSDVCKEEDEDGSEAPKINVVGFESETSNPKEAWPKLYRLPFFSAVKKNFRAISRLLADGYAIRTSFYTGKNFGRLKPGKIYKSPGRGRIRHAIVLIGAGRRGKTNYYHFLNSWGKQFCLRSLRRGSIRRGILRSLRRGIRVGRRRSQRFRNTLKALGGFGLLRASDIVARPVAFLRHEDDRKYYEELLLEDIVPLGKTKEGSEAASITPSWEASADCCGGYFAGQISAPPPPPPNDMTVRQVADKLASGRQFENITRQRNPGDTPLNCRFLFDKHCPDYKYYEFELAEEEKALAQSKEAEASTSDNSGVASFKAAGCTHRSSFEQKSNYQTPASALYGAYAGHHTAPPSDPAALMEFYATKAAQEEWKRPPKSKDEMQPSPLQGPAKKGHHHFIPSEEPEKFMARCNDTAAQKATKEAAGKAKIQAQSSTSDGLEGRKPAEGEEPTGERAREQAQAHQEV